MTTTITERAREIADTSKDGEPCYTEETLKKAAEESNDLEEIMIYLGIHGRQLLLERDKETEPIQKEVTEKVWTGWDINKAVRADQVEKPENLVPYLKSESE